jgi:hypothetical protein
MGQGRRNASDDPRTFDDDDHYHYGGDGGHGGYDCYSLVAFEMNIVSEVRLEAWKGNHRYNRCTGRDYDGCTVVPSMSSTAATMCRHVGHRLGISFFDGGLVTTMAPMPATVPMTRAGIRRYVDRLRLSVCGSLIVTHKVDKGVVEHRVKGGSEFECIWRLASRDLYTTDGAGVTSNTALAYM